MDKEIYRDISGYEGIYQVSNYGNVKSLRRGIILKPYLASGYKSVDLYFDMNRDTRRIHRLVIETFLPNHNKIKKYVNHKDGNKLNNYIDNLEWCTPSENVKHAYKTKLITKHSTYQKQPYQQAIKEVYSNKVYFSIRECERKLKIKRDTIYRSLDLGISVKNGLMKFEYYKGEING